MLNIEEFELSVKAQAAATVAMAAVTVIVAFRESKSE